MCYVNGKNGIGGLPGYNQNGTVVNSHAAGGVEGVASNTGGLVGRGIISTGIAIRRKMHAEDSTASDASYSDIP